MHGTITLSFHLKVLLGFFFFFGGGVCCCLGWGFLGGRGIVVWVFVCFLHHHFVSGVKS